MFAVLSVAAACEVVTPTNPFDPDAPLNEQATAQLTGTVALLDAFDDATRELALRSITVGLLDDTGNRVQDGNDVVVAVPLIDIGTDTGGGRSSGRFSLKALVPGTFTVVVDNAPALYEAPVLPSVRLGPGQDVDVRTLSYRYVGVGDEGPGLIAGEVNAQGGAAGQHSVSLYRLQNGVVTLAKSLITDRAFSFAALGTGFYAVVVESAGFTPVYRIGLQVAAVDSGDAHPQFQFNGDDALIVHPVTAALTPAVGDATVVLDEGLVFVRGDSAPLLVLPFVTDADKSLGITGMRLATTADFVDAAGVALPFVPHTASTSVPLPAADGTVTVFAQFEARSADNSFVFVSPAVSTTLIKDTTAPSIVDVTALGVLFDSSGTALSSSRTLSLRIDATDATSAIDAVGVGVGSLPAVFDDVTATPGLQRLQRLLTVDSDGEAAVQIVVEDRAGNRSAVVTVPVLVDTVAPSLALTVTGAADGFLRSRIASVDVASLIANDDALLIAVGLEGAVNESDLGPPGARTVVLPGSIAHGATVTFEAIAIDVVGNRVSVTKTVTLDLRGTISGAVVSDAVPAVVPSVAGAVATLLDARGGVVGAPVVVAADGDFSFADVAEGAGYSVRLELAGHATSTVRNLAVVVDGVVDLGDVNVALSRGEVRGRALRSDLVADDTAHAGIAVSLRLVSPTGRLFTDTAITDAAGRYAFRTTPRTLADEQVSLTAQVADHGSASSVVVLTGALVEVPDLVLPRARGDFDVCRSADAACAATQFFNASTVDIKLRDATDVVAVHVGLDGGATARLALGAGNRTTVNIAAAAQGEIVVAVQAEKADGTRGEILSATIVKDTIAPVGVTFERRASPLARDPRFTNQAFVDVVVAADAGSGTVAPLAAARVVFADTAPALPTAGFVACAHEATCRVALPAQERLLRVFAFSCDAAGNCAAPVSTFVVRDTTPPSTTNGAAFSVTAPGSVIDAGVTVVPSPLYSGVIDTGVARTVGGIAVVDDAGAGVADVFGFRFSLSVGNLGNASLQSFTDAPLPAERRNGADIVVPALPAGDVVRTVFAQFVDAAGNLSQTPLTAQIVVDVAGPVAVLTLNGGAATSSVLVPFTVVVPVGAEAPKRVQLIVDEGAAQEFTIPLVGTERLVLSNVEGSRRVVMNALDRVGNVSRSEVSIVLDRSGPRIDSVRCTSAECVDSGFGELVTRTSNARVDLAVSAVDAFTGVVSVEVSSSPAVAGGTQTVALVGGVLGNVLVAANTSSTLSFVPIDAVGNRGTAVSRAVRHDVTAPVIASFAIEAGAVRTNKTQVTVTTAIAAADAVEMRFSINATFSGAFVAFRADDFFSFAGADGDRQVCVQVRDVAGNLSSVCDSITLDRTPPVGTVSVPTTTTSAATVTTTLTYPADTASVVVSTSALSCDSSTTPYVTATGSPQSIALALPGADGERSVFACFKDQAGNAAQATTTITVDRTAPVASVSVNNGATFSTTTTPTARVTATADATSLALTVDTVINCAAATYVAFTTTPTVTLPAIQGVHTVRVCVRDAAGNVSAVSGDATITLDSLAPSTSVVINGGAAFARTSTVTLSLTSSADTVAVAVANAASLDCNSASYSAFSPTLTHQLTAGDGTQTVAVCVKDAAGLVSTSSAIDTIVVDTTAPTGTLTVAGGAETTSVAGVAAVLSGQSADTAFIFVSSSAIACDTAPFVALGGVTSFDITLSLPNTSNVVTACLRDGAGNVSTISDAIFFENVAGDALVVAINGGAATAKTRAVTLSLFRPSTDFDQMKVVEAPTLDCANLAGYEAFNGSKAITLSAGTAPTEGNRTVSACVRSTTSLQTRAANDSVLLDTFDPNGTIVINGGGVTANETVTATLTNAFAGAGEVVTVALDENTMIGGGGLCTGSFEGFSAARAFTFTGVDGQKTLFACFRDVAGNTKQVSSTVTLDRTPPSPVSLTVTPSTTTTTLVVGLLFPADATRVAVAEGALDCGTAQGYVAVPAGPSPTITLNLTPVDGTRTIAACFKDAAGNTSQATATTNLDRTPPAGTVVVNAGATFATSTTVSIAVQNAGDIVRMALIESGAPPNCATATFVAFNPLQNIVLSAADGIKTVQACLEDVAGNRALALSDTIILDRTVPNGSLVINNGDVATNNKNVTLGIGIGANTDVATFAAAEGAITCNAVNLAYQPFSSLTPFLLSSTDATKTVLVCLKDQAGNVSSIAASDTIVLDTAQPVGASVAINDGDGFLDTETTIGVTLSWTTAGDVANVKVGEGAVDCQSNTGYSAVSAAVTSTTVASFGISAGDGTKLVLACLKDAAGNIVTAQDTTVRDATAPTVTAVVCTDCVADVGAVFSRSTTLVLAVTGDESGSGLASARVAVDGGAEVAAPLTNGTVTVAGLAAGARTLAVKLVDRAGNTSTVARSLVVTIDQTAPVLASLLLNGSSAVGNASNSRTVSVSIVGASADTAQMAVVDGLGVAAPISSCVTATYSPFVAEFSRTVSAGDGQKAVGVCLKDRAGNVSAVSTTTTIIIDTLAPSLPAVAVTILDGGDEFLTTVAGGIDVRLNWNTIGDVVAFKIGEGSVDCGSEPYQRPANIGTVNTLTPNVTIVGGDGSVRMAVCFKDAAGNISSAQDTSTLDTAVPTGTIVVAGNAASTNQTTNVPVTVSSIDSDLTQMAIVDVTAGSPQTCANASYVAFSTRGVLAAFASTSNGAKLVGLCLRDRAGNQTVTPNTDGIVLDTILVATGINVSLQGTRKDGIVNPDLTRTASVVVSITGAAADVFDVEIANDSTFFGAVADIFGNGVVYPFQLDPGDGVKDVFVRLTDAAGNKLVLANNSPAGTDLVITLDTTPPSAPLIVLANNANFTSTTTVATTLIAQPVGAADGAIEVRVSANDFDFADGGAENFSATFPTTATLTAPDGTKTVIAQFRDQAGNETAVVIDSIDLDTSRPLASNDITCDGGVLKAICINQGALFSNSVSVNLQVTASLATGDHFTNAVEMQVAVDGSADTEPFVPYTTSLTAVLPAGETTKTVAVRFKDAAGNVSAAQSTDTIVLDTVAPTAPRIATQSSVIDAASIVLALAVNAADTNFADYQIRNGGGTFTSVQPIDILCKTNGSLCTFAITLNQDNENRISLRAIDLAGNVSVDDFVVTREDGSAPAAPTSLVTRGGNGSIEASWTASASADVAGYRVYYRLDDGLSGNSCSGQIAAYTGSAAAQGASPIDVGLNTQLTLTALSNGVGICIAVTAYDRTTSPAANESVLLTTVPVVPSTLTLVRGPVLNAAQLGISGAVKATAIRNGLLYVAAINSPLVELDGGAESCFSISDPTTFAACAGRIVSADILGNPKALVLHGAFAFVADTNVVKVFRISSGSPPLLVQTLTQQQGGALMSDVRALAVEKNFLVAGHANGATVFSLNPLYAASPLAPTPTVNFATGSLVAHLGLQAGIATASNSASAFDLNSGGATVVKGCSIGGFTTAQVVAGSFLYAATTSSSLNVCDRSIVSGAGQFPNVASVPFANFARSMVVVGPYIVGLGQGTVTVLDASNRYDMSTASSLKLSGFNTSDGFISVAGHRLFASLGNETFVRVLYMGEPRSFERVATDSALQGELGMLVIDDLYLNGEKHVVHLGRVDGELEQAAAVSPLTVDNLVEENNTLVSLRFNSGPGVAVFKRQVAGISALQVINTAGYFPNSGIVSWPYLITVGNGASDTNVSMRVFDLRSIGTTTSSLNNIVVASGLENGPARLAMYGDDLYVASSTTTGGLLRVAFNPLTGALGAVTPLLNQTQTGVLAYGRRIVIWQLNSTMAINHMVTTTWNPATPQSINGPGLFFGPSRFSKPALSGRLWILPGGSNGYKFIDLKYATTAPFSPTATQQFLLPVFANHAAIAGDRIYLTRAGAALEIMSFR